MENLGNKAKEQYILDQLDVVLNWPKDLNNLKRNIKIGGLSDFSEYQDVINGLDEIIEWLRAIKALLLAQDGYTSFPYKYLEKEIVDKLKQHEASLTSYCQRKSLTLDNTLDLLDSFKYIYWDVSRVVKNKEQISYNLELDNLKKLNKDLKNAKKQYDSLIKSINDSNLDIIDQKEIISERCKDVDVFHTTVKSQHDQINKIFNKVEIIDSKTEAEAGQINEVFTDIENKKKNLEVDMKNIKDKAEQLMELHKSDTSDLLHRLMEIEKDITDKLKSATGISLFHSFKKRKDTLWWSKLFWLVCMLGCSAFLILEAPALVENLANQPLYVRFGFLLPVFYILGFVTKQYSNNRRLEEVYAMKSNISLSLSAYQQVIKELIMDESLQKNDDKNQCVDFMVDSIKNIFASPLKENKKDIDDEIKHSHNILKDCSAMVSTSLKAFTNLVNRQEQ